MGKKIKPKQKEWFCRHARFSFVRTLRQRKKSKNRRILGLAQYQNNQIAGYSDEKYIVVDAPDDFSLTTNYEGVMGFINELRDIALLRSRNLSLNFTTIKRINPAAALVLAAEVDRWRRTKKLRLQPREINKWDVDVRRQLCEKGFFQLLDVPDPGCAPPKNPKTSLQMIRFITGKQNDGQATTELRREIDKVAGTLTADDLLLYDGLMEATLNAVQHAYPATERSKIPWLAQQWWMSGSFDGAQRRVTIMVYDQGVGIPRTLPTYNMKERLYEWLTEHSLSPSHHGVMIKGAMSVSRSSTDRPERGNGLAKIREIVEKNKRGSLRILSGKGEYRYESTGNEQVISHAHDFGGTLVQWEIDI